MSDKPLFGDKDNFFEGMDRASGKDSTSFHIVQHVGDVQEATTLHGQAVERKEYFEVDFNEDGQLIPVPVAQYDNHFLYEVEDGQLGPAHMCTCGSPAVYIIIDETEAPIFVCLHDANTGLKGLHQTSVINKKDWNLYSSGQRKVGE